MPQTGKPILAVSEPMFAILRERLEEILLFNNIIFRLSIHALVAKIQPDKVVRCCPDGKFLAIFRVLYFQRAARSTFQTCILNSHLDHTMTAKIRREKKKKKEDRTRNVGQCPT